MTSKISSSQVSADFIFSSYFLSTYLILMSSHTAYAYILPLYTQFHVYYDSLYVTGRRNTAYQAVTKSQRLCSGIIGQSNAWNSHGNQPWQTSRSRDAQVEPPTASTSRLISCISTSRTTSLSSIIAPPTTNGVNSATCLSWYRRYQTNTLAPKCAVGGKKKSMASFHQFHLGGIRNGFPVT